jgi:hypothetical protein
MIVSIPMKPHLLLYLRWREDLPLKTPYLLANRSPIGRHLSLLFCGKKRLHNGRPTYKVDRDTYTATLQVQLPSDYVGAMRIFVPDSDVVAFNQYIHDCLHENLMDRISAAPANVQIKEVIEDLIDDMDAWGEVDFETLKKANYRIRKSRGLPMRKKRKSFHSQY